MQLSDKFLALFPSSKPIAVAVSGGGDSMALLGLCLSQAGQRSVHALIVDHGLRDGSESEAKLTARRCSDMGATPHILTWRPSSLTSAIQEQARKARYGLMGQACRGLGASDLLVGHTQDDQAETIFMREESGAHARGLAGMNARTYAPVWPQLYGVYLNRPLLGHSRASLRKFNKDNGVEWLEDPSNSNMNFQRVRARAALAHTPELRAQKLDVAANNTKLRTAEQALARTLMPQVLCPPEGGFHIARSVSIATGFDTLLSHLIACASGGAHHPDMAAVTRLINSMGDAEFSAATLGGAVIARSQLGYEVARETGRWLAVNESHPLERSIATIFDGRYAVTALQDGYEMKPIWPYRKVLPDTAKAKFKTLSKYTRRSAFGIFKNNALIAIPQIGFADGHEACSCEDIGLKRFLTF